MSVKIESLPQSCTVSISGDFTLVQIGEIKNAILQGLDSHGKINLDLIDVTGADTSCLQLFCAIHKSLRKRNGTLHLKNKPTALISNLLTRAGYFRHSACIGNFSGNCILMEVVHE
jgi:anti-anti-sigma regulatory factor